VKASRTKLYFVAVGCQRWSWSLCLAQAMLGEAYVATCKTAHFIPKRLSDITFASKSRSRAN